MDAEQKARRLARQTKMEEAVEEYIRDMVNNGDMPPGVLSGFVCGMSVVHFDPSGSDEDGIVVETTRNMNGFHARGVADATAERMQQSASGFYDMPEDD